MWMVRVLLQFPAIPQFILSSVTLRLSSRQADRFHVPLLRCTITVVCHQGLFLPSEVSLYNILLVLSYKFLEINWPFKSKRDFNAQIHIFLTVLLVQTEYRYRESDLYEPNSHSTRI
jgi:hypothetical protein